MKNNTKKPLLTFLFLPLFLISCEGLKNLTDKTEDDKTPTTDEVADSTPPAPPQTAQWDVNDINGNWVSDCVEVNNGGMDTIRYIMTFSANTYDYSFCNYSLAAECQSNINGALLETGSAPTDFYPNELKAESASLGKDITVEDGYYFIAEINGQSEGFFWGSPTSKDTFILQDIGNAGMYNAGVVDYDAINSQNSIFFTTDLTQTTQSDIQNQMVLFSRINGAVNLANYGCSTP